MSSISIYKCKLCDGKLEEEDAVNPMEDRIHNCSRGVYGLAEYVGYRTESEKDWRMYA